MTRSISIAIVVGGLSLAPVAAQAQSAPKADVAVSWIADRAPQSPAGFAVSIAHHNRPWRATVGEFSRTYGDRSHPAFTVFEGGARFMRPDGRVRPYGQILAGIAMMSDWSAPVVDPGGGVEVVVTRRLSWRTGASLPVVLGYWYADMRLHSGVVFSW